MNNAEAKLGARAIGAAITWLALPTALGFALAVWVAEHGSIGFLFLGFLLGVSGVISELAVLVREKTKGPSKMTHWHLTGIWSTVGVGAVLVVMALATGDLWSIVLGPFVAALCYLPALLTAYVASRFTATWQSALPAPSKAPH